MAKCSECSIVFSSINALLMHLKLKHKYHNLSIFKCREQNCHRNFHNIKCFRQHFKKMHGSLTKTSTVYDQASVNLLNDQGSGSSILSEEQTPDNSTTGRGTVDDFLNEFKSIIKNEAIKFIAHLYNLSLLPRSHVQLVIDTFSMFFNGELVIFLETFIIDILNNLGAPVKHIEDTRNLFSVFKQPFADLSTEFLRLKALENSNCFIRPVDYTLGERRETVKISQTVLYKSVPVTAQFIPLRLVFSRIFENTNMLKLILDYKASLQNESEAITDFTQSKYWLSICPPDCGNKITLPIFLYYDDYETGNPLGSHAGIHKLGAIYVHLPCLLPTISSKLENYFLFFLFHSEDRKSFGMDVFKKVVDELQYLETTGINIQYDGKEVNILFKLAMILGDNLGLHTILGFSESFNTNFPCRFCKVNKTELQILYKQNNALLRSRQNYDDDCKNKSMAECGIKQKCVFNSLESFHAAENYCVDVMHDLLEGVCNYDFQHILKYFILEEKYFSLEALNFRIHNLTYIDELDNKPPGIPQDFHKKKKLNFSSSEMLCFVRYFCFMIGDLVPKNNPIYEFYLILRQIVDICVASSLSEDIINYLEWLVSEHNYLYKKLFKDTLKPKHHLLIHYPYIARLVGPFVNFWSMRYESKHRESKMTADVSCSRKNITKTLAVKHQLKLCYTLLRNVTPNLEVINGSIQSVLVSDIKELYPSLLNFCPNETSFFITKWVRIHNILFKRSTIIELESKNLKKKFGVIKDIFLDAEGKFYFL